jgi:ribosomal protein L37E
MALYEHFWDCPACGTKGISALRKRKCPNCGYSKTSQDTEIRSDVEITDSDGVALARGGPHWECSSCGSVNLDKYEVCEECGNPKEVDDRRSTVRELGSTPPPTYRPPDADAQWYPKSLAGEAQHAMVEFKMVSLPEVPEPKFENSAKSRWLSFITVKRALIALVAVVALTLLGYGIFHTREIQGQVTGFSWSRDVAIERYLTVHESGWLLPAGAYNVSSEERISHYDPVYEEKQVTVHHSQTCYRDLGNGSEESYDCSYDTNETERVQTGENPVYETWYEYNIDKWVYARTVHASGNDRNPYWPEYTLNFDGQTIINTERVGGTSETYMVYFEVIEKDKLKTFSYQTSESEWQQYALGKTYLLRVNHFDAIMNNPLEGSKLTVTITAQP